MADALSKCMPEGRTIRFGKEMLRGSVAVAYYRLADAATKLAAGFAGTAAPLQTIPNPELTTTLYWREPMDLYFAPLSCSLATRIALYETGQEAGFYRAVMATKQTEDGRDYLAINPKGQGACAKSPMQARC